MEQLGEGGMGVVYVGRHEKLGHRVVVKVLRPELSRKSEMVQRFFNEAQAATAIHNLGIAQVFDVGLTPEGQAYFVMELLQGETLTARMQQRRLDFEECCRIVRQVANVLQAAHAAGITHRDLKPDNLFLVPDAEVIGGERVKVLDFGIAKLTGEAHVGVQTRTGLVMGTPSYMAPEQCRGIRNADARSDIYSLGCILFKMACGRPPFVGVGLGDIVGAHLHVPPPNPQELAPDMPAGLAALISKMLAKSPDDRPQTMAAVSQEIDEILRNLALSPPRAPKAPPGRPTAPLPGLPPAQPPAHSPTPRPVAPPVLAARSPSEPAPRAPSAPAARALSEPAARPSLLPTQQLSLEEIETTTAPPLEEVERTSPSLEDLDTTAAPPVSDRHTAVAQPLSLPPVRAPAPAPVHAPSPSPSPSPSAVHAPSPSLVRAPAPLLAGAPAALDERTTTPFPTVPAAALDDRAVPPAPSPGFSSPLHVSEPFPVLRVSPSSTTISGAVGIFSRPPPTRGRRLSFALGGLVILGAVVAIVVVLATADSPEPTASSDDITPPPADNEVAGASPAAPPAGVGADGGAGSGDGPTSAADPSLMPADDLASECRGFQVDRAWDALARCADQLMTLDPAGAAEFRARAEEGRAAPRIAAFEAALRVRNLRRAKAELDQIGPASTAHAELARRYELAETQAITALAAELAQVKDSGCEEYHAFLAKQRASSPSNVLAEAVRRTPCVPQPACNVRALAERGQQQYSQGLFAAALASYEAAYACRPSPDLSQKAFVMACNLRHLAKSKLHWRRLPATMKKAAVGVCVRNRITEETLNAL